MPTRPSWPQADFLAWLDALKLRHARDEGSTRPWSDSRLAAHWGIGHSLISGWRNDRQRPSIPTLNQIAAVEGEDARRLWVLAGAADAADVGLLDDERDTLVRDAELPAEFDALIAAYRDGRMRDEDRNIVARQVGFLAAGIVADLDKRETLRSNGPKRRRAG